MKLTMLERETILNFNEAERDASVYTHNPALKRKLEQLTRERPDDCRLVRTIHDGEAVEYMIPKSWIKVKPPRVATQTQKEAWRNALDNRRF